MPISGAAAARRLEARSVAEIIGWARAALGLTYRELGALAGATTRTAQRWADADAASLPRGDRRVSIDELRDLRRLLAAAFQGKTGERAALEWLHREVPLLEHRRPIDLIRRGELAPVVEVLAGAHAGAFV